MYVYVNKNVKLVATIKKLLIIKVVELEKPKSSIKCPLNLQANLVTATIRTKKTINTHNTFKTTISILLKLSLSSLKN